MKIWLVLEKFYCDTTVVYAYADDNMAAEQADLMSDQAKELGESGYYYIESVEVL